MSQVVLQQIEGFLSSLETLQAILKSLYRKRKDALTEGDLIGIKSCHVQEEQVTKQLQQLLEDRKIIIQSANQRQFPGITLREVAQSVFALSDFSPLEKNHLEGKIKLAEEQMAELRQESWTQWIIANRNLQYVNDVIELIANGGKKRFDVSRCRRQSACGRFLIRCLCLKSIDVGI